MEFSIQKIGLIGMAIVGFLATASLTILHDFFLWLPFGLGWFAGTYLFIVDYYAYLLTFFFVVVMMKKTRNVYWLLLFGLLFFLFLQFVWI